MGVVLLIDLIFPTYCTISSLKPIQRYPGFSRTMMLCTHTATERMAQQRNQLYLLKKVPFLPTLSVSMF